MTSSNKVNLKLKWEDPETGKPVEQVFALPVDIGRDTSNHIVLSLAGISRHHARIEGYGEEIVIRDLKSSNGTLVNGKKIEEASLQDGDMVSIGGTAFAIEFTAVRPSKPSMDHLFGALIQSEAEPTITLSSLDKKALFADLDKTFASKETAIPSPSAETQEVDAMDSAAVEKLSGDELRQFLSKPLQKNIDKDIAPDVETVVGTLSNKVAPAAASESSLGRFFARVRQLFGGS